MLKIHSIFKSIQGEGIDIGIPMIFVRFAGCNLACSYCDTKYASREKSAYQEYTVYALMERILETEEKAWNNRTFGVTLTGGEPFVQNFKDLSDLIYQLKGAGFYINIETNGVYLPTIKYAKMVDRFSVSPKLESSGNFDSIKLKTLEKYKKLHSSKTFFKFVISKEDDFIEMLNILDGLKIDRTNIPVVVQPNVDVKSAESIDSQIEQFKKVLNLVVSKHEEASTRFKIRVIPQFHKFLWANKKGV